MPQKAGYYSTETAKSTLPDTQETIDFLMRELNEKVYPTKNGSPHFFSAKDIETIAYGVRVNGPRTHVGRFPKIVRFDNNRVFAVTAVGARGLLYHALLGEWVANGFIVVDVVRNHRARRVSVTRSPIL